MDTVGNGRYEIVRLLGEGSRKLVYLARDTQQNRDVALALIKSEGLDVVALSRVRRETQAMARLVGNAHIVTVYETGDERGQPYIVSEYLCGGDLEHLLERAEDHRLTVGHTVRLADNICQALEYAHEHAIVHRDLKPANVWLDGEGVAKLGDFGLAVALDRSRLTAEGMMVGTLAYMPPEQALGRPPDARADLYALGAMLYEMVAGRPPFLGDDAVSILSQHINTPAVAPSWHNPDVPQALEGLILQLLAKAPEDRPQNATTVRAALRTIATVSEGSEPVVHSDLQVLDQLAGGVFVGRERELAELRRAVNDVLSGHARLLLLVGEPGIGKTRTAEELATYARLRGAQVLTGRCHEGEGAPAYWPWVQLIRAYVHQKDPAALMAEMGPGAADVAQVVSAVRERFPDLPAAAPFDGDQARFRFFDSLTTFLKNAAQAQPLVLILDDLHWADKASLLLLQFLARHMTGARLLIVGSYRDVELGRQHPLSQTLGELAREQLSQRLLLRGVTEADVARFIEMTANIKAPEGLVAAVYKETEGNPFFINEVVRLLVAEGRLEHPEQVRSWSVGIPQSVREVIGRRFDRLSEDCNRVLSIASVIGREFSLGVLERAATVLTPTLGTEALLDLLEEAVAARVIVEVPRAVGRYSFSHALVRETLYEELSLTRRVRLHRQIGEALEGLYQGNVEPHLAELAHHFLQAAQGGDVPKAIDYATRAGERADRHLAYEEAVAHYERALEALDLIAPDEPRRCELLLARGASCTRAGERQRATESFLQAAAVARNLEPQCSGAFLARAALGVGGLGNTGTFDPVLVSLLEEALAALGEGDQPLRARVLARLANELLFRPGTQERRAALSKEAVEMARRVGDPTALGAALNAREFANWRVADVEGRLAAAAEIGALGEQIGDKELVRAALELRLVSRLELGDIRGVDAEIETYTRLAEEMRQPVWQWYPPLYRAMRALLDGRFDIAEEQALLAMTMGQRAEDPDAVQFCSGQLGFLQWMHGRLAELEDAARGAAELYSWNMGWQANVAWVYSELGRETEARAAFERLAAHDFSDLPTDTNWLPAMQQLCGVCVFLNDQRRAGILYELFLPYEERNIVGVPGFVCFGPAARNLGLLAATLSRWDDAVRHLDRAVALCTAMGARPLAAVAQLDYASVLVQRGRPGDPETALGFLTRCLTTAQELGITILVERALALKLRIQGISSADARTSIDAVALAVQAEQPDLTRLAAPDGTVTIVFSDIEGSTAMVERLGDQEWVKILRDHNTIIRDQLAAHRGAEVKSQGDGFMLAFATPQAAVSCSAAVQRALSAYSEQHAEVPIRVRIGVHTGEVIHEAGDFFGKNVNLAARVAAHAKGGEILVSSHVRQLIGDAEPFPFGPPRRVQLKGLADAYTLHAVEWGRAVHT